MLIDIQNIYQCRHSGHPLKHIGVPRMYVLPQRTWHSQPNPLLIRRLNRPYCDVARQEPPCTEASDCPRFWLARSPHPPLAVHVRNSDLRSVCFLLQTFQTNVLTHHSRMVLVAMVDRMNKSRIVYQAARMYSPNLSHLHSESNIQAVPLLAFLTFGTRPVCSVFSPAYILSLISFLAVATIGFLPSHAPTEEVCGRRTSTC